MTDHACAFSHHLQLTRTLLSSYGNVCVSMPSRTQIDLEACDTKTDSKLRFANPVRSNLKSTRFQGLTKTTWQGPFGYGAFATTLMTLSLSMMGVRNVENQTVFIANLCFLAGIGLFISAQWEMVRGNTFAYTTLIAFGQSTSYRIFNAVTYEQSLLLRGLRISSHPLCRHHGWLWRQDGGILQCFRVLSCWYFILSLKLKEVIITW